MLSPTVKDVRVITYSWAVAKWFADSRKNIREVMVASFLARRSMPPMQVEGDQELHRRCRPRGASVPAN
jgi:hypothetical protein